MYLYVDLCVCVCVRAQLWKGHGKHDATIAYLHWPEITSLPAESQLQPRRLTCIIDVFTERLVFDMLNFTSRRTWQSTADYVKQNLISRETFVCSIFWIPPGSWKTVSISKHDHEFDRTMPCLWRHCVGEQHIVKPRGYMSVTRGQCSVEYIGAHGKGNGKLIWTRRCGNLIDEAYRSLHKGR